MEDVDSGGVEIGGIVWDLNLDSSRRMEELEEDVKRIKELVRLEGEARGEEEEEGEGVLGRIRFWSREKVRLCGERPSISSLSTPLIVSLIAVSQLIKPFIVNSMMHNLDFYYYSHKLCLTLPQVKKNPV